MASFTKNNFQEMLIYTSNFTPPLRIRVFHSLLTFLFHPNFVGFKNYSSITRVVGCFTPDEAHEGGIYENLYTHLNTHDLATTLKGFTKPTTLILELIKK